MSLTDDNSVVMPVAPMGNSGFGGMGGDSWAWILILLLFAGGGMGGFGGGNNIYPWMNQSNQMQEGFTSSPLLLSFGYYCTYCIIT